MYNYTWIMLLCEDRQQEVFMRNFLVARGVPKNRIRANPAPKGMGSAEQFVRNKYPQEVNTYRSKCNHLKIALAVMLDADIKKVVDRLNELDGSLVAALMDKRRSNERIGLFVPKRNIETWIHYLMGVEVDEERAYSKLKKESDCKSLVTQFAKDCSQPFKQEAPSSLQTACTELRRIL